MKILFDQNISFRLVKKIKVLFPDSAQVRELKLENLPDIAIWRFARENGYSIVTFDADYADLAALYGPPPKIVWIRNRNLTTSNLERVLNSWPDKIKEFIYKEENKDIRCLEIFG